MARLHPIHQRSSLHGRFHRAHHPGQSGFGLNQVDGGHEEVGVENLCHMGAHLLGKVSQDADDLPALLSLQLADAVVGLHHLGGLYE